MLPRVACEYGQTSSWTIRTNSSTSAREADYVDPFQTASPR
jgi:hypothetical protein